MFGRQKNDRYQRRSPFANFDRGQGLFGGLFGIVFAVMFSLIAIIVFGTFGLSFYFGYECYKSNDPKSMACYFLEQRRTYRIIEE